MKLENPIDVAKIIIKAIDTKKASDIKLLHVEEKTVIADYFIICSGTSRTQIKALADEADHVLEEYEIYPHHTEGADAGTWILKDYGSVILHIFNKQTREFYNLEKLYEENVEVDISDILDKEDSQ